MKLLKFVLFLVAYLYSNIHTYSQSSCKYSYSWGFSGESFELLDSNNFIYRNSSCTHSLIGYGKYIKTKKKIKLFFEESLPLMGSFVFKIDSTVNTNSDSVNLNFSIKDIKQQNLLFATISILDSSFKKIKSTYSNENGIGKLHYKKSNNIRFIEVNMTGFKKIIVPIKSNNFDYHYTIYLNSWTELTPKDWKVFVYKIRKQKGDVIELKKGKSKYLAYKVNCKN